MYMYENMTCNMKVMAIHLTFYKLKFTTDIEYDPYVASKPHVEAQLGNGVIWDVKLRKYMPLTLGHLQCTRKFMKQFVFAKGEPSHGLHSLPCFT